MSNLQIVMVPTVSLKHIEGFSPKRVKWLTEKIQREGIWNKPLALEKDHHLVLDGQHRMEVARFLGLREVPAVLFDYAQVEVWSLRPKTHQFDWREVVRRSLADDIYPYKTVKHGFSDPLPACALNLSDLLPHG